MLTKGETLRLREKRRLLVLFTLTVALLTGGSSFLYIVGQSALGSQERLISKQSHIDVLDGLLSTLKDAETEHRAYLVTGRDSDQEPFNDALVRMQDHRRRLAALADSAELPANEVDELLRMIDFKLQEFNRTIELRRSNGLEAALAANVSGRSKQMMDQIRSLVAEMHGREEAERNLASDELKQALTRRKVAFAALSLFGLAFISWVYQRIVRAVNERKQAEQALRESEERLQLAADATGYGTFDYDPRSGKLLWSGEAKRHFGLSPEGDVNYETFLRGLHPDDREHVNEVVQRSLSPESGGEYQIEYRTIGIEDRKERWISATGKVLFDSGAAVRFIGATVEITDRKRAESELRESEERVRRKLESLTSPEGDLGELELEDLLDAPAVQRLLDDFYAVSHVPVGIIDVKGKVLVGCGWQDICTRYHRVHPDTCAACVESDTQLTVGQRPGESRLYKCKNSLWDMATPIYVAEKHVGNIFTGQFFFEDEIVDRTIFRAQAREFGFNEEEYLAALDRVPRLGRQTVNRGMAFFTKLAEMLSQLGYSNAKLARTLAERERLTRSLQESEGRLRRFYDSDLLGVLYWNMNGRITDANDRFLQLTGYSRDDLLSERINWGSMTPTAFCSLDAFAIEQLKATGVDTPYEKEFITKDGRRLPVLIGAAMIDEQRHNGVAFVVDISEQKAAEEQLRRSRALLSEAEKLSHTGAWEWDVAADRWSFSDEWLSIHGASRAALSSDELLSIAHPDDRAVIARAFEDLRKGTAPYSIEHRIIRTNDGAERFVRAEGHFTRGSNGEVTRAYGFAQDITERKRLEEQLRAAETSANRAREAAERANRAKDEFLAVLSHELRTPLTPVLAAVSLLKRTRHPAADLHEHLEVISRNISLEARLIDDLLDLTRIARGKIVLEKSAVDIGNVLTRAAEVCRPDIEARNLHFALTLADRPLAVHADMSRLQQVFWNLINNSVKFSPDGGCIGVRVLAHNGDVIVEVADSGIGIEADALTKIFDAFEQTDRRITRQFGGLGLGLAITKRLVELHNGTIRAHSNGKGQGATFKVVLPLHREIAAETLPRRDEQDASANVSKRILLVEDHGDTALMTKKLLQASGYEVETAADVGQALEAINIGTFQILISDLGLPDRSGLELIKELRGRGSRIPAIALSGYGREEDISRSKAAGFSEHLTKPVNFDTLVNVIERVGTPP